MDFKESIHADTYDDEKGSFDVNKFIHSVDVEVSEKNKMRVINKCKYGLETCWINTTNNARSSVP